MWTGRRRSGREALEKRRRVPGEEHPDTVACVQAMVDLDVAWDKAEPVKGYDAKARQWRATLPEADAGTK